MSMLRETSETERLPQVAARYLKTDIYRASGLLT